MAIIDVVKYNADKDTFAWKFPKEDLSTWTQLIVNESQEAVLFKDGKALDVFESGRYTLETKNIPLLNNIINLPFGGRSPFAAEVWFVNKLYKLDIKWGTTSPIQVQDKKYNVFFPVRANGQFGIRVSDSRAFLTMLVGTLPSFDEYNIRDYFRGIYMTKVKDIIASYIVQNEISIMDINAYIDEVSMHLKERIAPEMQTYGIELINFYVNDLSVPEDDPAVKQLKAALAKKAEMDIIGYDYRQERSFDVLEGAAKNEGEGSASLMGAGIGLGMGAGVGGVIGQTMGSVTQNMGLGISVNQQIQCPKCNMIMEAGQKFCSNCGFDLSQANGVNEEKTECPNCKALISKENKFCPECGTPLKQKCPKCGVIIEGTVKFCPECGEKMR